MGQNSLTRRLAIALAFSGILNISLLAYALYEWQEGGFSHLAVSPFKPFKARLYRQDGKELATLTQTLRDLEALDCDQLVAALDDPTAVCEGYKKQQLALSMLVMHHYFDIERALSTQPPARRLFKYMSQDNGLKEIILFPDLGQEQMVRLSDFAKIERYPITAEGLHLQGLKEPFRQSDEFRVLELLLRRNTQVTRSEALDFALTCDYKQIKALLDEMRKAQDLSPEVRRSFLLKTLPQSAAILVKTDPRYALHSMKEPQVLLVLANLKGPAAREYAIGLLEAPRSQAVWQNAVEALSASLGLDASKETRHSLLVRLGRLKAQVPTEKPKPNPKPKTKPNLEKPKLREITYTVQAGDSLWHISKRFSIDVELLKKHNKLTSDALKPGSTLRIPLQQQTPPPPK